MTDLRADYLASGFAARLGPGNSPAVLVVDIVRAYLDDGSILRAPVDDAVRAAAELVSAARDADVPVVFTTVRLTPGGADGGLFRRKVPALALFEGDGPLGAFAVDPAPRDGDVVVVKQYASAFFGTSLASTLRTWGIDTLYICGLTTSGCVRASATDALQHGFRPMVVADACGDRDPRLQEANLLDLDAKYADVVSLAEALRNLGRG
ncbi:isochorismatase family protein [Yinghuangia soli]|uniref:Isochorismatase family protein n=1 Tax=Yinghuangia soli TaxID=2908204 RepID=A0AA41U272_9ACTN|nr:isochorismatase family protein [Yinghuangia soli]MCF2531493.1 isochorismatase family protein [Yinghuangia soli]